jgi:hypothetical protein
VVVREPAEALCASGRDSSSARRVLPANSTFKKLLRRKRKETAMIDRYYRDPHSHDRSIVPDLLAGLLMFLLMCFVVGSALGKTNYTDVLRRVQPLLQHVDRSV